MMTTFYGLQFFYDDEVEYPTGQELLSEGHTQNRIFVLRRGSVDVYKGSHKVAHIDKRGDLFGEISALLGTKCTTTVKTHEPSTFYTIENADEFLAENAATAFYVSKMLAARLTSTTNSHALLQIKNRELENDPEPKRPM